MSLKIGFIVNPIAGMGGKVGLKGTDGVIDEAIKLGAKSVSPNRAFETLKFLIKEYRYNDFLWLTCSGEMGEFELKKAGFNNFKIVYKSDKTSTTRDDTRNACKKMIKEDVDLIVFCGGDGTTRDIFEIVGKKIPILGIPSGVKMHSGVFGVNTIATAKMINEFIQGSLTVGDVDIMDLDEDLYRKGEWSVKLFGVAKGIVEPTYIQVGKSSYESLSDNEIKDELAEHILDEMEKYSDFLFLLGSGGTIDYIADKLGIENTILGVDAVFQKRIVGKDLNENGLLNMVKKYQKVKLILSPIGAQGFILGRGNLQLSPKVIKKIGFDNIIVVSTPSKLLSTPIIRVDTGDKNLDKDFVENEFMLVVIGYRMSRVVKIQGDI